MSQFLRNFFAKQRKDSVNIARSLRRILTAEQYVEIQGLFADPLVLSKAASVLDLDERVLVSQVAGEIGLGFTHRVFPYTEGLPAGLSWSALRQAHSIPAMLANRSIALITIDLSAADELRCAFNFAQTTLATLQDIEAALDESEKLAQNTHSRATYSRERLSSLAQAVLAAVIEQVGNSELRFERSADSLMYSFQLPGGRSARGSIQPIMFEPLWRLLREKAALGPCTLTNSSGANCGQYSVLVVGENSAILRPVPLSLPRPPSDSNVIPFPTPVSPPIPRPAPTAAEGRLDQSLASPAQVWVVDDNVTFVRVLERFFERHSLSVTHASDGTQALAKLESAMPELIVCDVHMPGMNGTDLLKALRSNPRFDELPIIMLTSDDDIELKIKLLDFGADAYLSKNEDPRLLCVQAHRLISRARRRRAA